MKKLLPKTQRLILPINRAKVTASMGNAAYQNKFGFPHYGVDLVSVKGERTVYASGAGTVLAAGKDSVVGNVVAVCYPGAWHRPSGAGRDVVFRYYHLEAIHVVVGQAVSADTRIGLYGNTGQLSMARHLHLEADADTQHPLYSPTVSRSSLLKGRAAGANDKTMSSPLEWLYAKTSPPDNQSYTTAADVYINPRDMTLPELAG